MSAVAVLVDGRKPSFRRAMVCDYRYPGSDNPTAAGTLTPEQVRLVDADLAAHMTRSEPTATERRCMGAMGPVGSRLISAVDAWGSRVDLTGWCGVYGFVDDRGVWYWTPSASTSHLLDSVSRPVPHPTGFLQGRLVEVGGPYPGAPRPLSGTVNLRGDDSIHVVNAGRDGRFSVTLVAGRYRIAGSSPLLGAGHPTCGTQRPYVTVRAHETTRVSVVCSIP